jgi:hypothetical protein
MSPQQIADSLQRRTKSFADEVRLHEEMERAFTRSGFTFAREVRVAGGRLDFLFADGTAVEVKVRGSGPAVVRQVIRYFADPRVQSVIVVSVKAITLPLREFVTPTGKIRPIHLVELWRNAF